MRKISASPVSKKIRAAPRWVRIVLRSFAFLIGVFLMGYFLLTYYVSTHKKELLALITTQLNENLNGSLTVENMDPTLLQGLPRVSINLKNVTIRDSLYNSHKRILLQAQDFNISVNALAMLRGTIEIKKIAISNATIDMFTDANGYSNTSVFKKSKKKSGDGGAVYPEIRLVTLRNVTLKIENLHKKKRHEFVVNSLKGNLDYTTSGWDAHIHLKTLVNSMAFNTGKGSFIKNKIVEGTLQVSYNSEKEEIRQYPSELEIGEEDFTVDSRFQLGQQSSLFEIHIKNDQILWQKASALLSPNISTRVNRFGLKTPIQVTCDIVGDLNVVGDPFINVKAKIRDNVLETPGGTITNCSFDGEFTNNYKKEDGFNDANSAIKLFKFKGDYTEIPFFMEKTMILNLKKPIAVGDFRSKFDVKKINNIVDSDLLAFSKGNATVNLNYTADIVNYKIAKPIVRGRIEIEGASLKYVPRNLSFKDISVLLNFDKDDLFISKIHIQTGKSIINMEGKIKNFLNLYYTNPEKIVLNWEIDSPQLYLGEFMGFLGRKKKAVAKKSTKGNFTTELNTLLDKSKVSMNVRVARLFYNKFSATNTKADIVLTDSRVLVKNAGFNHAGGTIKASAMLKPNGNTSKYILHTVVSNVDVSQFFNAFNNFGQQTLQSENLKGKVSIKTKLRGSITENGTLMPNSMNGNVAFNLQNAALLNFSTVKNIGNMAFPNRNFDNISISELNGELDINGKKIVISPMQFSSSVLNMDIAGVYSFGKGTQIYVDVPLRNPQRDKDITDEIELAKRRNRGIVLHLIAADGTDGKVKIKLGAKK